MINHLTAWGLPTNYQNPTPEFQLARVLKAHKSNYEVVAESGIFKATLSGKLLHSTEDPSDNPQVGDWVGIMIFDEQTAFIMACHPRSSALQRASVGAFAQAQVLAANIDVVLIVQGMDHNYNLNRLERYLVQVRACAIEPLIILTKADLCSAEECTERKEAVRGIANGARVILHSMFQEDSEEINQYLSQGKTAVLVGSSGAGKSTLVNLLMGTTHMATASISASNAKGRHTTSHRELVQLQNGALLIDTPGTREFGLTDSPEGIEMTFEEISQLSGSCKFRGCTHEHEPGCAVQDALEDGRLEARRWHSYQKLHREQDHYGMDKVQRRKKDKALGKVYRSAQNDSRRRKGRS
ncbi:ribosome small subunit-dependent GTPase A [Persicobacter psychrovividus]|uniref:Small ribosomal subunit biogenesis GTPase RsgA n=1 Tax=Persicobacter psychrovividus TaxID=387638 RepID=A0ABM7VJU1_9BACT|nr:putative ribosome biogenesis GTPase RsgA [Persicobacter psychrovividus]